MTLMSDEWLVLAVVILTLCMTVISYFLSKKLGTVLEVSYLIIVGSVLFYLFPFWEAMMLTSYLTISYGIFGTKIDRVNRAKHSELRSQLEVKEFIELNQMKDIKRLLADIMLVLCVVAGSLVFYFYAPETYMLMKFLIVVMLIGVSVQMIERIGNYQSTRLYWLSNEERIIILSSFQSRELPLKDLKEIRVESTPDLLKLHPLFTILSSNQDYTNSFRQVLKLSFPGEYIYISPNEVEKWRFTFGAYVKEDNQAVLNVYPFWHPKVIKRLLWKGYFAITVKGISAYTGLLFLLIWLEVSSTVMIVSILLWWLFNLYISDRVLVAATDAVEMEEGKVFERTQLIFQKAGMQNVKLYVIDSPIHNGLATGMNIGRGTVMVTKATLELSIEAIEAIVAHEAIHIKKRDVLMGQLARFALIGLIAGSVYLFYDQIVSLADNLFIFIPIIYCLMFLFPIYLSFVAQWAEVRADHYGATLIKGGRMQMKEGLSELGFALDNALVKRNEYSTVKEENSKGIQMRNSQRNVWLIRFLEFQFNAHPLLYWRIHMLSDSLSWGKARRKWFTGKVVESLPDFLRVKKTV